MLEKELLGKPPLQGEVAPINYPKGPKKMPLTTDRPEIPMKPVLPVPP